MTDKAVYLETLLRYYEEEIMGEAYFRGLADHIGGPRERDKLALLAAVERRAAEAVQPLLQKHGLRSREESLLKSLGLADVERHRHFSWGELMAHMAESYPAYIDEFEALERLAPEADRPALERLTQHEVVTIEFAEKEIAGEPDSLTPLRAYLAHGKA